MLDLEETERENPAPSKPRYSTAPTPDGGLVVTLHGEPDIELRLHAKQRQAFESEATEILFGGAAGGGKSHLIRVAAIAWCHAIEGLQFYLFRRTHPDLFKNHMNGPGSFPELLAPWVDSGYASINYSAGFITIGRSKIHLCHCQHEKNVYNYQGAEMHVFAPDELTHFTAKQYRYLRSRVRLGGLRVPDEFRNSFPRILGASNPGGVGHNWARAMWIKPAPEAEIHQVEPSEGGMRRQYIKALLVDNPTMTENDPDYDNRLEGLENPALVRAMRLGDWNIVAGGFFDDLWNEDVHVLKPFDIPASWRIDRSFDWGSRHPFSVGWWAESDGTSARMADGTVRTFPRGTLFRIWEWYGCGKEPNTGIGLTSRQIARGILEREKQWGISARVKPGPADAAIHKDEDAHCIQREMEQEGVKWMLADNSPGVRVLGWQRVREFMRASSDDPMEFPGLFIFDRCRAFVDTVPVLPRDDDKIEDVDSDSEDHCLDGNTTVLTISGPKRITDLIGTHGSILTLKGEYVPFENVRMTRKAAETIRLMFSDGSSVVCTPDHRFATDKGWVTAEKMLSDEGRYRIISAWSQLSSVEQFRSSTANDSTSAASTSSTGAGVSIGRSGHSIMDQFRMGTISTTRTTIARTIRVGIWSAVKKATIIDCTAIILAWSRACADSVRSAALRQPYGTAAMLGASGIAGSTNGTAGMPSKMQRSINRAGNADARTVAAGLLHSARQIVAQLIDGKAESTTSSAHARNAAPNFPSIATGRIDSARAHAQDLRVVRIEPAGVRPVYCLTVPSTGCFALANGVIVANCADESRYRVYAVKFAAPQSQSRPRPALQKLLGDAAKRW